jgi:hypothetical protein
MVSERSKSGEIFGAFDENNLLDADSENFEESKIHKHRNSSF